MNEPPTAEALAAADYGVAPGENYESQVRGAMDRLLRDPESARYRLAAPEKGWLPRYHFDNDAPGTPHQYGQVFGWLVPFGVNAKNGFGGYAGEKQYLAYFRDGQLRGILQPSPYNDIFGYPCWTLVAGPTTAPE